LKKIAFLPDSLFPNSLGLTFIADFSPATLTFLIRSPTLSLEQHLPMTSRVRANNKYALGIDAVFTPHLISETPTRIARWFEKPFPVSYTGSF
jgi:hypothetical protein